MIPGTIPGQNMAAAKAINPRPATANHSNPRQRDDRVAITNPRHTTTSISEHANSQIGCQT